MNKTHLRSGPPSLVGFLSLLVGLSTGHAQTAPAPSAAPAESTVQLPQYTVSADKADAYRATEAMSLARISGAIIDTPVSINVISRELLDDLGANSTFEAARYYAGVGNGRGAGTNGGI